MACQVKLQTLAGRRVDLEVASTSLPADELLEAAARQLDSDPAKFSLVLRGGALQPGKQSVRLASGDTLLVVPRRKAPSERIQRAAEDAAGTAPDPDDEPIHFTLPEGCYGWEAALARRLQAAACPDLALSWLFVARPHRLLLGAALLAAAPLASRLGVGPPYLLCLMLAAMYANLGRRREGEASAYSVFNPGVRRLPGQLDADVIDQQIRQGHI